MDKLCSRGTLLQRRNSNHHQSQESRTHARGIPSAATRKSKKYSILRIVITSKTAPNPHNRLAITRRAVIFLHHTHPKRKEAEAIQPPPLNLSHGIYLFTYLQKSPQKALEHAFISRLLHIATNSVKTPYANF